MEKPEFPTSCWEKKKKKGKNKHQFKVRFPGQDIKQ